MGDVKKLYNGVRRNPANVRFAQMIRLAQAAGFVEARVTGSHHIFRHGEYQGVILNLQNIRGRAKPYQVRQFVALVEEYGLLEER